MINITEEQKKSNTEMNKELDVALAELVKNERSVGEILNVLWFHFLLNLNAGVFPARELFSGTEEPLLLLYWLQVWKKKKVWSEENDI